MTIYQLIKYCIN